MRFTLCLALQALLFACDRSPSLFAGRYVLDRGRVRDTLVLLPNGRYHHSTAFLDQRTLADSGTWHVTTVGGQQRLQIDHWVLWATPDSQQQILGADAGTWYAQIDSLPDGSLVLRLSPGQLEAFVAVR